MDFDPEHHADLVYQTKSAETPTVATMERPQKRGINYVKVIGSNAANFCTTFVGKVFRIGPGEDPSGQFLSSRALPRGGPPFHPRCTKRFVAFVLKLQDAKSIDAGKLAPPARVPPTSLTATRPALPPQERDRREAAELARNKTPPSNPDDDLVTVMPASPGEEGERIVGPVDLLANAKDFLARQTRVWADTLSAEEAAALRRYQSYGDGHRRINGFLREGKAAAAVELAATLRR